MAQLLHDFPSRDRFPDVLPEHHEIVRGILVAKAMPTTDHGLLQLRLCSFVQPFHGRKRTPDVDGDADGGGWWVGTECEIELFSGPEERYLPDLVGWRIDQVPARPRGARIPTWPQWICEILSPSTASRDIGHKRDAYHRARVGHYWVVDPEARTLSVQAWDEAGYRTVLSAGPDTRDVVVRAEPFAGRELDLAWLFDFE